MSDTLRDRIYEAIIPAMIEYGPDGHTDGSEEIADAVIAALGLRPRYKARLTSGGGSVHRTLEDAHAAHAKNVQRYGLPGDPVSFEEAPFRGEAYDLEEMPPVVRADGVYVYWETKAERIQ